MLNYKLMKIKTGFLFVLLLVAVNSRSQVLISILFGDALNTEKIEFGLIGGLNQSYFLDVEDSKGLSNFNIGFYFHFLLKNNSYLSTGVLVKSNVGATGMPTYPIGDPEFDEVYADGTLTTKLNYFYVPILFQQRIYKLVQLEGGFQVGLRNKSYDIFTLEDAYGGDLGYKRNVKDDYIHLDAGLMGGMGIKLNKVRKSMAIGLNYYYGLVNVSKIEGRKIKNSSLYLYVKIPIGIGKEPEKTNQ